LIVNLLTADVLIALLKERGRSIHQKGNIMKKCDENKIKELTY
jgi:hypothetical protein